MKNTVAKWLNRTLLGATAFVGGSALDTTPAMAHCGDHWGSCGESDLYGGYWCDEQGGYTQYKRHDMYANWCSGTCYNGGASGCCDSPEACWDAPCKPGGCGGACAYLYSWDEPWGYCGP